MKFALPAILILANVVFAEQDVDNHHNPCGHEQRNVLQYYDFNKLAPMPNVPGNPWEYIEIPFLNFTSRGGTYSFGPCGGFVNANPYNLTQPQGPLSPQLNSLKFLIESSGFLAPVPSNGELSVKWKVAVENFKINDSPFPKEIVAKNDVRLGSGVLFLHDLDNDLYFDWLITNDRIYARYARDQLAALATPGYAAFVFIIPVAKRHPSTYNKLRVTIDAVKKHVHWFVDGKKVYTVEQVGYLLPDRYLMTLNLGGVPTLAFPTKLRISFGAVTLLDNYPACKRKSECSQCQFPETRMALVNQGGNLAPPQYNPLVGPPTLASYWDPLSLASNRLWGQGTTMSLKELIVYQTLP